jgi:hypothetical protein
MLRRIGLCLTSTITVLQPLSGLAAPAATTGAGLDFCGSDPETQRAARALSCRARNGHHAARRSARPSISKQVQANWTRCPSSLATSIPKAANCWVGSNVASPTISSAEL